MQSEIRPTHLTGRIQASPSTLLHDEVLEPQFRYELAHLLPWYLLIEKVLLIEYERMGILDRTAVSRIRQILDQITPAVIEADPVANMSDIAFAIERYVEEHLDQPVPAWHVDRSRNDFQVSGQVMFARSQLLVLADQLLILGRAVVGRADRFVTIPMPGYTHYQSAQVISPGFYLAALSEQVIQTLRRLQTVYDELNESPLGAGAMAGQELPWDRHAMARLLGFSVPRRHALTAVASREWLLRIAAELSMLSTAISRFVTDLILWGSSEYRFLLLPDEMAGISSAMPQKRNYPILERIRGRTAHIIGFNIDYLLGQRNTAYTNLVEVSKEASTHFYQMLSTQQSVLRLLEAVIHHLDFDTRRMREACGREYLGGFTLANRLTLNAGLPYRKAQSIVGRYIASALEQNLPPDQVDLPLLTTICCEYGYDITLSESMVAHAFGVEENLQIKQSFGSTAPDQVREMLKQQAEELNLLESGWGDRHRGLERAYEEVNLLLPGGGEER